MPGRTRQRAAATVEVLSRPQRLSLCDALSTYLDHLKNAGRAPAYVREIESFLGFTKSVRTEWIPFGASCVDRGIANLADIRADAVNAWLDHLRTSGRSQYSYAKFVVILKRWLSWLLQEGLLSALPLRLATPKTPESQIAVFTVEEVRAINEVVKRENLRDQAIFMLLVDTGVRANELCSLALDDVHISGERAEVTIRAEIAKSKKTRTAYLTTSKPIVKKYLDLRRSVECDSTALFLGFYSSPVYKGGNGKRPRTTTNRYTFSKKSLTRTGLFKLVQKWGKLAEVTESRCSPHTFRHYYAVNYIRNGGDVLSLQRLLGHSKLEMTQRYAKLAEVDLKARQDKYSPALQLVAARYQKVS